MPQIEFAWDPAKAASNVAKHRVTFAQAAAVLLDPLAVTVLDTGHGRREERWLTVGMSRERKLLAVSHTYVETGLNTATVRIISAREANRQERRQYEDEPF